MNPAWLYLIAGLALVIGSAMQLATREDDDEDEDAPPWGFNITDSGLVDGGESEWEAE